MKQHGMCTLDCFDICSLACEVEAGKIVSVKGWAEHPLTQGFICPKGRAHGERLYDPKRIVSPMIRTANGFQAISNEEALNRIADHLKDILNHEGSEAITYYCEAGYSGISKHVDEIFFNCLGGAVTAEGGLCWSAGIKAQKLDFGEVLSHSPEDLQNSDLIVLWGRNPKVTNIHLVPYLMAAKKRGAKIILIDPIKSDSVALADWHIAIKPGSDGALALGMIRHLTEQTHFDYEAIQAQSLGLDLFLSTLAPYTLSHVSELTGLSVTTIEQLTAEYSQAKAASIYLGYGPQRYSGSVNAVRAIDALGMIAGHVGKPGGGVNYANRLYSDAYGDLTRWSEQFVTHSKSFKKSQMGQYLCQNPPRLLWISKGNPVAMMPNANQVIEGLKRAEMTVVVEHFMTDTALQADLILPDTMLFETPDVVYTSMFSSFIGYSEKMVEPPAGVLGEFEFFNRLAERIGLKQYPYFETMDDYFEAQLETLFKKWSFTLEALKSSHYLDGRREHVPWSNGQFRTKSGKFEFYSESAASHQESPVATYIGKTIDHQFPYRLLTPHLKASTGSQHLKDDISETALEMSSIMASRHQLKTGDRVCVTSRTGTLVLPVLVSERVEDGIVVSHAGRRLDKGLINRLTTDTLSDFGVQAAYYDTFVHIMKVENDDNAAAGE